MRAAERDRAEADERFHQALDLVDAVARHVSRTVGAMVELDDLLSFGREGLLDAARRYDPSRGVPFRAYASYRVRGAVMDGVRTMSSLPRRAHERLRALQAADRVSEGALEDIHAAPSSGGAFHGGPAEAELDLGEHLASMATAVAVGLLAEPAVDEGGGLAMIAPGEDPEEALGDAELLHRVREAIAELPREEAELVRRHYLEGERFDRVARDLGISKSWASRLHTRAVRRLTRRFRE